MKNYYANTQEDKFYTIGGTLPLQATYEGTDIPNSGNNIALSNGSTMVFSNVTNIEDVVLIGSENSRYREWKPSDLGTTSGLTLNIDKLIAGNEYILHSMYKKEWWI